MVTRKWLPVVAVLSAGLIGVPSLGASPASAAPAGSGVGARHLSHADARGSHHHKKKHHHHKKHRHHHKKHHKAHHANSPAKAAVSFGFVNNQVTANSSPVLSVASSNVPASARLVLQREMGTAAAFQAVATLRTRNGQVAAPAVPMGRFAYRIRAVEGKGHAKQVLATSVSHILYSFGTISLAQLLGGGAAESTTIGDHTFNYVWSPNIDSFMYGTAGTDLIGMTSSTCREIDLQIGAVDEQGFAIDGYDITDSFTMLQATRDPQSVQIPPNTVASARFAVVPGQSWTLRMGGSYFAYLNGSAQCWNGTAAEDKN